MTSTIRKKFSVSAIALIVAFFALFSITNASATTYQLTVQMAGTSTGTVTSTPAGITCSPTCSAAFPAGTVVSLKATAKSGAFFAGWSGACKGAALCKLTMNSNQTATATFNLNQTSKVLNHIIFMAQENRSLDHYFGALREYWRANKFADISFDGLPQFNPTSGTAPLYGPPPSNPGCDPAYPYPRIARSIAQVPRSARFN